MKITKDEENVYLAADSDKLREAFEKITSLIGKDQSKHGKFSANVADYHGEFYPIQVTYGNNDRVLFTIGSGDTVFVTPTGHQATITWNNPTDGNSEVQTSYQYVSGDQKIIIDFTGTAFSDKENLKIKLGTSTAAHLEPMRMMMLMSEEMLLEEVSGEELPIENEAISGEEIVPVENETTSGEEITPVTETVASGEEVTPVTETVASGEEVTPVTETVASGEEVSPVVEQTSSNEEEAPVAEQTSSNEEETPVAEQTSSNEEEVPVAEQTSSNEEEAPVVEQASSNEEEASVAENTTLAEQEDTNITEAVIPQNNEEKDQETEEAA